MNWQNRRERNQRLKMAQRLPVLVVGAIIILVFLGLIASAAKHKGQSAVKASPSPTTVASPSPVEHESSLAPAPGVSPSIVPNQPSSFNLPAKARVPILMYHYIRDYTDPKDKLGINLSVSPMVFNKQLDSLANAGFTTITFQDLTKPLPAKPIILTFDDGYADAFTDALPDLLAHKMKGVFYIVSGFVDKGRYVTNEQVKQLDAAGMEIGSHTINHVDLAALSEGIQEKQLTESKKFLETLIGKPVTAFCYPAGKYNAVTIGWDGKAGYSSATTTQPGVASGADFNSHPFQLPRVRVTPDTDLLKILGEKK